MIYLLASPAIIYLRILQDFQTDFLQYSHSPSERVPKLGKGLKLNAKCSLVLMNI